MRPLTDTDILRLWEWGRDRRLPVERALALLATAEPDESWERLSAMSIGQRDGRLLSLRGMTFGQTLGAFAECPGCREGVEFTVAVNELRSVDDTSPDGRSMQLMTANGYTVRYRLPNSSDFRAIPEETDLRHARRQLLRRCILEVRCGSDLIDTDVLPPWLIRDVVEHMAQADPQADTLLGIQCPACGEEWEAIFDIAEFFWAEIADYANRLLREVHQLARGYCWSESDILAMSVTRRQWYLEMLGT